MRRLLVLAFIWGWSFLFIKVAVAGMTPPTVAALRMGLGMLVLLAAGRRRGLHLPTERAAWGRFGVVALAGSAAPFTLLAWAEQHISSALAAVLNASTPLFAALFVAVTLGERLQALQLAGLGLGFVGVGVAAGLGAGDLARSSMVGGLAAVAAAACYGVSFAYSKRHLVHLPPLVAATGQLVMGTAMTVPLALATTVRRGIHLTPSRVAAVGVLGILGTGAAYVLNYRSIAELGPTRASVVTYLVPVVAVAVGVVLLHERFSIRLVLGALLTTSGIAMLGGRLRRRGPATVPA